MQPMISQNDESIDSDATAEQLAELMRLGIAETDLEGLTSANAEEWIDELRTQRRDAGRVDRPGRRTAT